MRFVCKDTVMVWGRADAFPFIRSQSYVSFAWRLYLLFFLYSFFFVFLVSCHFLCAIYQKEIEKGRLLFYRFYLLSCSLLCAMKRMIRYWFRRGLLLKIIYCIRSFLTTRTEKAAVFMLRQISLSCYRNFGIFYILNPSTDDLLWIWNGQFSNADTFLMGTKNLSTLGVAAV